MKWVAGNLYERLDAPELARVGILNLDEYGEVANRTADADFPLIRGLVKRGLDTFGEFALFWNQDLDAVVRRRQDRGQALRRHAEMVCSRFAIACLAASWPPRRCCPSEVKNESIPNSWVYLARLKFIAARIEGIAWRICGSS